MAAKNGPKERGISFRLSFLETERSSINTRASMEAINIPTSHRRNPRRIPMAADKRESPSPIFPPVALKMINIKNKPANPERVFSRREEDRKEAKNDSARSGRLSQRGILKVMASKIPIVISRIVIMILITICEAMRYHTMVI